MKKLGKFLVVMSFGALLNTVAFAAPDADTSAADTTVVGSTDVEKAPALTDEQKDSYLTTKAKKDAAQKRFQTLLGENRKNKCAVNYGGSKVATGEQTSSNQGAGNPSSVQGK